MIRDPLLSPGSPFALTFRFSRKSLALQCLFRTESVILATPRMRLTEARLQLIFKQRAVHDVNIDESFFRMPKCARQSADNFETKLIPKMDRARVCGNHEIELHSAKAHSARLRQTVLGHPASHSGAFGVSCHHESGVGDVRPGTRLVRPQNISADDAIVFFRDVSMSIGPKPISQCLLTWHLRVKCVCIACHDDLGKDVPDCVVVGVNYRTYLHGRDPNNANRLPNFSC